MGEMETERNESSIELNYKRAKIFFERKTIVHTSLNDGKFYNGLLFSVSTEFFEIHDRVSGVQLVFFSELKKPLQEYMQEERG